MIKTQIIGHLAHDNKLFDVQCTKCFMMYDSKTLTGSTICPKCNSPLDSIRTKNDRTMAISEGTIYPTLTEADKEQDAENVAKRKNAMPITHRFVLFSFADPETGILQEPPVHQYLAKGREIMVEVSHNPIASWYKAKDQSIKLELRYTILYNKGDKIQLLGRKEVAGQPTTQVINQDRPALGVTAVNTPTNATVASSNPPIDSVTAAKVANIQAQLNALIAAQKINKEKELGPEVAPVKELSQQELFATDDEAPF